eukprot:2967947-Prymnesium_polylepis.1
MADRPKRLRPLPVVRVYDAQKAPTGLGHHITYRVLTLAPAGHPKEGVYDVRRRYSDFDLLRATLASRYEGMILPPLPGKGNLLSSFTSNFQNERQ